MTTHVEPSALYGWGAQGPDSKFYGHAIKQGGMVLWVYDAATNTIRDVAQRVPASGGEVHPVAVGTDGLIYGGGSGADNRAAAYGYNPATGEVMDFGVMGPSHSPNACWGYSIAADEEYIYMASGKVPWYIVALNKQTRQDEVLTKCDDPRGHSQVGQGRLGCTASVAGHGKTTHYWLYKGKAIEKKDPKESPPWPENPQAKPWVTLPPQPEIWTGKAIPKADGKAELWYRLPEAKAAAPNSAPAGTPLEQLGWKGVKYNVDTYPVPILFILPLDDGRIFGAGQAYMGNFVYDPQTNQSQHLGRLPLSHYSHTLLDGKVYMSGYPSSVLYRYDPAQPWTSEVDRGPGLNPLPLTDANSNPRQLCYLAHAGSGCHKMWTACHGGDGRVYFGGRWYRNGEQGGLGWWNPREPDPAKAAGGLSAPFANFQVLWLTPTKGGRYIAISTAACRDQATNTPPPKEAKVFVFDTQTLQMARDFVPVPDANWAGGIVGVDEKHSLGLTFHPAERNRVPAPDELTAEHDHVKRHAAAYGLLDKTSVLYKADVTTGHVLWREVIPYPVSFRTNENFDHQEATDFELGPDGKVWTFTGSRFTRVSETSRWHYSYIHSTLVRIDPFDGRVEAVGKLHHGGDLAFAGRDLYLSGGCKYLVDDNMTLRRIRGILPPR
jgi:hypothetical protein